MPQPSQPRPVGPVVPGGVYEIQMLFRPLADAEAVICYLHFTDSDGAEVDLRLGGHGVPFLDPVTAEILPEEVPEAARWCSRFFVAPPDAVKLAISCEREDAGPVGLRLNRLGENWIVRGRRLVTTMKSLAEARLAHLEALDWGSSETRLRVKREAADQIYRINGLFARRGNWSSVIAGLAIAEEDADHEERLTRLSLSRRVNKTIAFIGRPRTLERLRALGDTYYLREASWKALLDLQKPDLIVIETAPESGPGDWSLGFQALDGTLPEGSKSLIAAAKELGIPVHLFITEGPGTVWRWQALIGVVDRVIVSGDKADWGKDAPEGAVFVRRAGEPVIAMPATLDEREEDLLLVPGASDLFQFPGFIEELKHGYIMEPLLSEHHFGFDSRALAPRLDPHVFANLPKTTYRQQLHLLRHASVVLLRGTSIRSDADMLDLLIDAVMAGAVPVIYGPCALKGPLVDQIERVMSPTDLQEFQLRARTQWWRERTWRRLYDLALAHHCWTAADREALLGEDVFEDNFANPKMSVILVSRRAHLIDRSLQTFRNQTWPNKELILVLNLDRMPAKMPKLRENERVYLVPSTDTIGRALNLGIANATGDYWCKMDDDDVYSRTYLAEYARFYHATQADSLGRQAPHYYFEESDLSAGRSDLAVHCRKRAGQFMFSSGTALSGRKSAPLPPFPNDLRNSTDIAWIEKVAADPDLRAFCYDSTSVLVFRAADEREHTWQLTAWAGTMERIKPMMQGNLMERFDRDA